MARLATSGFETQSLTIGHEWSDVVSGGGGTVAIDTTTKRSGTASLHVISSASASNYVDRIVNATNLVTFSRVYIYVVSRPTDGPGAILGGVTSGGVSNGTVAINNDGSLALFDGAIDGTQRGSNSAVLSLNTWYMVELKIQNGGTPELEARLDGVAFASGAMTEANNANTIAFGMGDFVTNFEAYFDDFAVNDTSGTAQTSYPGEGHVVHGLPTGAGDNAADLGVFSAIDERTPNDATDFIDLDTATSIGDYAMQDSSTLGIDSYDTITLVEVFCRIREEASATSSYQLRLKSAASGTLATSTATDAGNTTWRTNPSGTSAFFHRLVSYIDPTTGVAWTPTGTNSIDNMQAGVASLTTSDIDITTLHAVIEYVDGVAPGGAVLPSGFMTTNTGFW